MAIVTVLDAVAYPLEGFVDYAIRVTAEAGETLTDPNTRQMQKEIDDRVRANGTDLDFQAAATRLVTSLLTPPELPNEVLAGAKFTITA